MDEFELANKNKLTGCEVLKVRYSDREMHRAQRSIEFCNKDHQPIVVAREVWQRLFTRRMAVRLVRVRLRNLIQATYQIDLFNDSAETTRLYHANNSVKLKYGENLVMRPSSSLRFPSYSSKPYTQPFSGK